METTLAIIILVIVVLLLAALVVAYARLSGPGALRAWLVMPASLRDTVGGLLSPTRDAAANDDAGVQDAAWREREPEPSSTVTLAYDETALTTLRGELERRIGETHERQVELDERMQRIDIALTELRGMPDELTGAMRLRDRRTRREVDRLRVELEGVRRGATASGTRRDEAYAALYGHLAQIEASLATAINPMLLPGEPLQVPAEFAPETLEAESWDEVGEHAYAFGMAFNRDRLVLDTTLAHDIEQFLATLRQALTARVYPAVRRAEPTRTQLAQMRSGLEAIVERLGPVRRQIERAWHEIDRPSLPVDVEDDDDGED